jgi:hypothetical protein
MEDETIFISIASFNEEDLNSTIESALIKAAKPERLRFGVFEQISEGPFTDYSSYDYISSVHTYVPTAVNIGMARLQAAMLRKKEDYYFQIDAHMIFESDWDIDLLRRFNEIELEEGSSKTIISTYVPWWSKSENGVINHYRDRSEIIPTSLRLQKDDTSLQRHHPTVTNGPAPKSRWIEHYVISGHFLFSRMSFLNDIMPDPLIVYEGEENIVSMRAWTNGYRIFSIDKPICWHRNKYDGAMPVKDWRKSFQSPFREEGKKRVEDILCGELLGEYGAPSLEKLREYEEKVQINHVDFYESLKRSSK